MQSEDSPRPQRSVLASRQFSDSFDGCTGSEPPDVRTLSILLATIVNWEDLGVKLGLDLCKVEEIKQRHNGNPNLCKTSVYDTWLRLCVDPSWRDVVHALEQMDENNLANKIKQRYSMYFLEGCEEHTERLTERSSPAPKQKAIVHTSSTDSEAHEVIQLVFPVSVIAGSSNSSPLSPASQQSFKPSPPAGVPSSNTSASIPFNTTSSATMHPLSSKASSSVSNTTTTPLPSQSHDQDPSALIDLLKSMTIEDSQQINIDCKVYNADTNQIIESTKPPLTRDIRVRRHQHRVQEFSSDAVPIGTSIRIEVTTGSPCFLYILNIGTSGKISLLLPNEYDPTNRFSPNQTYHLPGPDFGFEIEGPPGKETIQIFAFSESQATLVNLAGKPKELFRDIACRRKNPSVSMKGYAQIQFDVQ